MTDLPRVRGLDAFPVEHEGRRGICLRDPEGLSDRMIVVPENIFFIITMLDGANTRRDVQEAYMRRYGHLIYTEHIDKVIEELDRNLLLQSDKFAEHLKALEAEFAKSPTRHAIHAGRSYEAEPEALTARLKGYIDGAPADGGPAADVRGLVAPHIDMERGGRVYGRAFAALTGRGDDPLFVILGTAHAPARGLLIPTAKDFATPLGMARTDRELAGRLWDLVADTAGEDEFLHRGEHSIEFQVLFLQHVLGGGGPIRILPVLCGSFTPLINENRSPYDDTECRNLLDGLRSIVDAAGDVVLVAGVDLAHVGPMFGDDAPAKGGLLAESRSADEEMLDLYVSGDSAGFYDYVKSEGDRRRICGLASMWWLLELLSPGGKGDVFGRLLSYEQWADDTGRGSVSFAAIAFD